jgi:hypothetical protein
VVFLLDFLEPFPLAPEAREAFEVFDVFAARPLVVFFAAMFSP